MVKGIYERGGGGAASELVMLVEIGASGSQNQNFIPTVGE